MTKSTRSTKATEARAPILPASRDQRGVRWAQRPPKLGSGVPKPASYNPLPEVTLRILVVEDERKVAQALKSGLETEGYEAVLAETGEEGFFLASGQGFDIVVLDVMLPGRNGLEILSMMRKRGIQSPVVLLTAKDAIEDRIVGLDSGADDYVVKPFAFAELLARIRALLRRGRLDQVVKLKLADLDLDVVLHRATRAGQVLQLTVRELELLEYLLRNQGNIVSREMLARDVWRETGRVTSFNNVVEVHIGRLRKKLDDPFMGKLLHTVRGLGYVLKVEEA
jgi:two-component system, OmpR family, copper resistance phosphate regulon response regulator CusR